MSRPRFVVSGLVLALVILFIYYPSLWIGFFAQDYDFLNPVASLDPLPYLRYVLDPRVQVLWYRPLQGIQFLIEFVLFGSNPVPYHAVNIGFHIIAVVLLFALVSRLAHSWRIGFCAALFYTTLPVYALAVNWVNITEPLMTVFYLSAIWFWVNYLERHTRRDYALVLIFFALALLHKQMAITLPAILFLIDFGWLKQAFTIPNLIKRYTALGIVAVLYFITQYFVQSTHVFAEVFGYSLGVQVLCILLQYLLLLVFPWGYYLPTDTQFTEGFPFADTLNFVWLGVAAVIYLFALWRWRSRALLLLGIALVVMLVPVLPFPFVELRYLYLPAMALGIILGIWLDYALTILKNTRWARVALAVLLGALVGGASLSVANANAGIAEIARQRRVPFRDITRRHPTFAPGTHLYFIDPITPLPELTGMFLMQYGRTVSVGGDREVPLSRLRNYSNVLVYYFDDTGKPIEVPVDSRASFQTLASYPVYLGPAIVLDDVELARTRIKPGEPAIVLLYWHRRAPALETDYTVFVHLINQNNRIVAQYDAQPRKGTLPTSRWLRYVTIVDPIVLPIPTDTPPGDYRLAIGMYEPSTGERLLVADSQELPLGDSFVIQPITIAP